MPTPKVIRKTYTLYMRSDEEAIERADFDKYFYGCDAALHRAWPPKREVLELHEVPEVLLETLQLLPELTDDHA